jgi:hypothetical protein
MPSQRPKSTNAPFQTLGGQKLKQLRQAAMLSLLEFAATLGSQMEHAPDVGHIDRIETGSIPSITD